MKLTITTITIADGNGSLNFEAAAGSGSLGTTLTLEGAEALQAWKSLVEILKPTRIL